MIYQTQRPRAIGLVAAVVLAWAASATAWPAAATHGPDHSYSILVSTGVITPATTELTDLTTTDDQTTTIDMPIAVTFYGHLYPEGHLVVSSNGNIQFTGDESDYPSESPVDCLPESDFEATVFAFFSDLITYNDPANGVFTDVIGTAPTRQLIIEWRTSDIDTLDEMNFEIILYEASPVITVIYGNMGQTSDGGPAIVGVQETSTGPSTEHFCEVAEAAGTDQGEQLVADGTRLDFIPAGMTGSVTVNKTGTSGPLAGAGFTLYAQDCTTQVAGQATTDAGGMATFTGIATGAQYCLVETTVPAGYLPAANVNVTLTLDPATGLFGATIPVGDVAITPSPSPSSSPSPSPSSSPSQSPSSSPSGAAAALPDTSAGGGTPAVGGALVAAGGAIALWLLARKPSGARQPR